MMRYRHWLVLALALWVAQAPAAQVRVLALFPGKAMLEIDGRRQLLRAGEQGPSGVRLLEASPQQAVLEIDGRRETLGLGRHVGGGYAAPRYREVRIPRDNFGSYVTTGTINGRSVEFLVDTGASSVALSGNEARRLTIPYRLDGEPVRVATASGLADAYRVQLKRVRVGEIELRNVQAVVIEGGSPRRALLGMSFLGRLDMDNQGNLMVLRASP